MRSTTARFILSLTVAWLALCGPGALAQSQVDLALAAAFKGAEKVDLRTSKVSSVVTLREVVKIPPPSEAVLVKTFKRDLLPDVLKPAFKKPGTMGVTAFGKYIAILHTDLQKEYDDVLRHELVHAYISLASPQPLPFWFQEGSAVHFSMDKTWKFYGQPSKDQVGLMVGRTVELDPVYKQKLQSFHYMIDKAGKKRFHRWYRHAVMSGVVDPGTLLGVSEAGVPAPVSASKRIPTWLIALGGGVVVVIVIIGFYATRRDADYY